MTVENMPIDGPSQFALELADIKRRLANLETARRLDNASFSGRLRSIGPNGEDRVIIGDLGGGIYGARFLDENGAVMFQVDQQGFRNPYLAVHTHDSDQGYAYNGATWANTRWWMTMETVSHRGLAVRMSCFTEAGVTGQIRLINTWTGATTNAISFGPGGGFQDGIFRWLHGLPIGFGPYRIIVQAQRTGGSGNFFVYDPNSAGQVDGAICTATGV